MTVLNARARLWPLYLLTAPLLTGCQTAPVVDTSETERIIIETVTVIDDAACEALTPSAFGLIDGKGAFNLVRVSPEEFDALPEWVRVKIKRDDTAWEEYCL